MNIILISQMRDHGHIVRLTWDVARVNTRSNFSKTVFKKCVRLSLCGGSEIIYSLVVFRSLYSHPHCSPLEGAHTPPEGPVSHTSLSENSLWFSLGLQTLCPWGQAGCEGAAPAHLSQAACPTAEHLCPSGMWVPAPGACQCEVKVHWRQEHCFPFRWGLRFLKHESLSNHLRSEAHSWGAPLIQGGASRTKLGCRMVFWSCLCLVRASLLCRSRALSHDNYTVTLRGVPGCPEGQGLWTCF